ncbi:MAG: hypothetical protein UZ22_OP11002000861 [Microgenomates bacterium OLB23]|nr:MAG: hypothetical protein UZ22_OP11002000861 [Microgenomates bacterium OLB23]
MPLPFLTKKESDIYQLLLKEGELPVNIIVTKTKLKARHCIQIALHP